MRIKSLIFFAVWVLMAALAPAQDEAPQPSKTLGSAGLEETEPDATDKPYVAGKRLEDVWEINPMITLNDVLDKYGCKVGGLYVLDFVKYSHANGRDSGLEFDTARPSIRGDHGSIHWQVEADLIGVDTPHHLYEAWVSWEHDPRLSLSAGRFRVALGSEFATKEKDLPFAGYGFTSHLDGRYDTGVRANGSFFSGNLWYETTATLGKGFGLEGQRKRSPQYSLRLVNHPFGSIDPTESLFFHRLRGLFLGAGYAYQTDTDDPIVLVTPYESGVFRTGAIDGHRGKWLHLEAGYRLGPVCFGWERIIGSADRALITGGYRKDMDQLTAWSAYFSWNLTAEKKTWQQGAWVSPEWPADVIEEKRGLLRGRWELAARYSNADMDRDLFIHNYTSYDPSTQEVRTFGIDLNWYPFEPFRCALGWVRTLADHELTGFGGTNRDSSYLLRLELSF